MAGDAANRAGVLTHCVFVHLLGAILNFAAITFHSVDRTSRLSQTEETTGPIRRIAPLLVFSIRYHAPFWLVPCNGHTTGEYR